MSEVTLPTNKEAFTAFVRKNNLEVANLEAINVLLFEMSERIDKLEKDKLSIFNQTMIYKGFKITPKQESIQVIDIITDTQ